MNREREMKLLEAFEEAIRERDGESAPDRFDAYIERIVGMLTSEFDMGEDEGYEFLFSVAEEMAAEGELPELPAEDADDADFQAWMDAAEEAGLADMAMEAAGSGDEEDEDEDD